MFVCCAPFLLGSHHQVSLFAELFNEMLQRDFGYRIYKALASLPAKDDKKDKEKEKKVKKEVAVTVVAAATTTTTATSAAAVVVVGEKKEGGLKRDIKKEKEEESEEPAGKKTKEDEEKKKVSAWWWCGDSGVCTDLINKWIRCISKPASYTLCQTSLGTVSGSI